jgi:putative heme-binding domain-containing protein
VAFGYGAKFPAKYQNAFYICDWSFGKLYAVHLKPHGSTYTGELEEFITGQPLALTDLVINEKDGAMYFAVGGRRTQSALYRVTYAGKESTAPARADSSNRSDREKRRKLEAFHGRKDPKAVREAWGYLDDKDRALRFAARIAVEWQNPAEWRERALKEKDTRKSIAALVALARASSKDQFHRKETDPKPDPALQGQIIASLDRIEWRKLEDQDRLDLLRAYNLAFTRLGKPDESTRQRLAAKFEPLFPAKSREVNAELAPMLVYLESPTAASKLVTALRAAPTQEEQLDLARALRVCKTGWTQVLREEYFRWFLKAASFKGGSSLNNFIRDIKNDALENVSEEDQVALKSILETKPQKVTPMQALAAREVVKQYTVADLAPIVEKGVKSKRDFERGRQLFGQAGCAACHRFNEEGASIGPDLTNLAGRFSVRDILESIIEPSKEISDQYGAIVIRKKDGDTVIGRVGNMSGDDLSVIENMFAPGDFTRVKRPDIESIEPSKLSMMPEGLLNSFKEDEILDIMAYLLSRGDRESRMFSSR